MDQVLHIVRQLEHAVPRAVDEVRRRPRATRRTAKRVSHDVRHGGRRRRRAARTRERRRALWPYALLIARQVLIDEEGKVRRAREDVGGDERVGARPKLIELGSAPLGLPPPPSEHRGLWIK